MPRNLILAALAFLTACGTAMPNPSVSPSGDLIPYTTLTPSPTFAQAPEAVFADTLSEFAERAADEIQQVHPALSAFMNLPGEKWQDVEGKYFG